MASFQQDFACRCLKRLRIPEQNKFPALTFSTWKRSSKSCVGRSVCEGVFGDTFI